MRLIIGAIIGAALMYLFDPKQGQERRETLGQRVRKSKDQAEHAVETGKSTFEEAKAKAQETTDAARSRMEAFRSEAEENLASEADSVIDDTRENVAASTNGDRHEQS